MNKSSSQGKQLHQTDLSHTSRRSDTKPGKLSRRSFLETSSAIALGSALASGVSYSQSDAGRKIRIGVVGGGFGCSFQWHEHPGCVVAAVSDLRPERRQRLMDTYKCSKSYNSLEELVLDKDIDAVAVFTDGPLHVQHTVEAMKHGKHVISAVPAAYGSIEQAELLLETVKKYGLTYMMAETSYFQQFTISARKFQEDKKFGEVFYCESEYQHDGLESLYVENGKRTWRYGMAPMHYPTHCTAHLVSVTGERLTEVVCHGWGNDDPILKDNVYKNPFWNESAMFKTDKGHGFRVNVWWKGAHRGCERAQWIGDKMSFYSEHPNGVGPVIVRAGEQTEKDDAGYVRNLPQFENYQQPDWWKTDMLPEPLRHQTGHHGSHSFLTHEFIEALLQERRPKVDIYEALAYTVPGIVAHESALAGGELKKIPQYDPA
ncbi:MAG: Gfo/Idh/MocA family oxidoreductase [Candidatus Omnitrophica bacterium]|nr:Gfo/Idh/MocA family oxidoreductase [bacterium]MCC6732579.1 Gfo/Idh/MocA family oxidoreductase [Candidatus Omnitrophota bacterium]MCE7908073.1 gfo/Idh/MocA family oxidoreductase [Candidatus Omnitrophica bacterium COP1]